MQGAANLAILRCPPMLFFPLLARQTSIMEPVPAPAPGLPSINLRLHQPAALQMYDPASHLGLAGLCPALCCCTSPQGTPGLPNLHLHLRQLPDLLFMC